MAVTAGALRLFDWMVPERGTEAHAFTAGDRIPFRSLCQAGRWSVKATKAEDETPRCSVCAAIVRGAAHRALLEIGPVTVSVTAAPVQQATELERRAQWGDR